MKDYRLVKISKYLSKHLRHAPSRIGIELAPGGWVPVSELLNACQQNNFTVQLAELKEVVSRAKRQTALFIRLHRYSNSCQPRTQRRG
ncbi:RNA 2'-phosphotransferase [Microcoleus sp. N9_B4]|uniref:RNA 2'-phosphotransferase n=1 Tax=Microcoleus sp. N9_B4 TaxID=3055386 RepID=UPI002FD357D0